MRQIREHSLFRLAKVKEQGIQCRINTSWVWRVGGNWGHGFLSYKTTEQYDLHII